MPGEARLSGLVAIYRTEGRVKPPVKIAQDKKKGSRQPPVETPMGGLGRRLA